MPLNTPVVFLVFKRPDTTAQVFNAIRQAQPRTLLIVADGPRQSNPEEQEKCLAVRSLLDRIDWTCDVHRNYSENNLGCKRRVASGLDWAFDLVDRAIILEDDCLPHPSFFQFCEELLDRFAEDERVMTISGNNFQRNRKATPHSYYFSRHMHCWGWATWQRAWKHFDIQMTLWPELRKQQFLRSIFSSRRAQQYWYNIFNNVHRGEIDSWAYIWQYVIWTHSGLNIHPRHNLVSNIGFGPDSTHTTSIDSPWADLPAEEMTFPLIHPRTLLRDWRADSYTQRYYFEPRGLVRLKSTIKRILHFS